MAVGRGRRRRPCHRPGGAGAVFARSLRRPRSGSSATARRRWIWPSDSPRTRWWRAMGLAKPYHPSLSLSLPLLCLPLFSFPGPVPAWFLEPSLDGEEDRHRISSSALIPVPPGSPRQFLVPLPATRVAGKPGPACWRCGDPGHFIDRCPVMEVGTLVRVPDAPQAAPDQAGGYQIPVSIRGGTYWALVDSGCNQPRSIKA